jgi:hypothetical protein
VQIYVSREKKIWLTSAAPLEREGYVRLFDVYEDRIEVYAFSPLTGKTYNGVLDRFTIWLNSESLDEDGDFWSDGLDLMPTHPLVPNIIPLQALVAATIITYYLKLRRRLRARNLETPMQDPTNL